ncbi:hypothetical protein [Rosistilla oblonga]|uniref:hypothetical protein n=1 Tax=Rosistilla oblonga TaxID=2527990 RepID=UPI003A985548
MCKDVDAAPMPGIVHRLLDWLMPSRICERTGEHDDNEFGRRIMKPGKGYRCVAETFIAFRYRCKRCGRETKDFHREQWDDSFTGVSMPSERDREMRRTGWIYWD